VRFADFGSTPSAIIWRSAHDDDRRGPEDGNLFYLSFSMIPKAGASGTPWTHPSVLMMELPQDLDDVDILVGLDIMLQCEMQWNGPAGMLKLIF
jgi:hypothetical protein